MCCIITSSLGKYRRSSSRIKRNFWRRCWGDIINIYQVPNHKSHLLAIYIICHLPLVFLSPLHKKLPFYSPSFSSAFLVGFLYARFVTMSDFGMVETDDGLMIRLQRFYNLWSIHVVILSFSDGLQSFYSNFISFFGTNLLTQCLVPVAIFCLFFTL